MFEVDELRIYRGRDIPINEKIVVSQPNLGSVEEFGEKRYFNAVFTLSSVGADLKWQLWSIGIDYTKIEDYELFIKLTSQMLSSKKKIYFELVSNKEKYEEQFSQISKKDLEDMMINPLSLLLKY